MMNLSSPRPQPALWLRLRPPVMDAGYILQRQRKREGLWLITPMTLFLLILLGFPLVLDLIYSVSKVGFETLRDPEVVGFGNYKTAISDPEFWAAAWLRSAAITSRRRRSTAPIFRALASARGYGDPMLPMMVAPAVGLMYRLIPRIRRRDFTLARGRPSSAREHAFNTLVTIEILQWTPFALLILYTAHAAIPGSIREAAAIDGVTG
jgi:multiple sugar transport system permease protein